MLQKNIKKSLQHAPRHHWFIFALSYLYLAHVGISELLNEKYIRKSNFQHLFFYEKKRLIIPILWNLKHALDLTLKALEIRLSEDYSWGHNLKDLHEKLTQKMNLYGVESRKSDEFEELVCKYYGILLWDGILSPKGGKMDIMNDYLRYPETPKLAPFDISKLEQVNVDQLHELASDIDRIYNLVGIIDSEFSQAIVQRWDK
jgi:hypothetical protein